jgi:Spy/CpxP family protein refolding chaperone
LAEFIVTPGYDIYSNYLAIISKNFVKKMMYNFKCIKMKTNSLLYKIKSVFAIGLMVFIYSVASANNDVVTEQPQCPGCKHYVHECLNLTDEQETKIEALRLAFIKEVTPIHNDIEVKQAMLKAASTGDDADIKKANQLIDEISQLKASMAKKKLAHRQEVRKLLSDEQKVIFDSKAGKGKMHKHHQKGQKSHCKKGHGAHGSHGGEGFRKLSK